MPTRTKTRRRSRTQFNLMLASCTHSSCYRAASLFQEHSDWHCECLWSVAPKFEQFGQRENEARFVSLRLLEIFVDFSLRLLSILQCVPPSRSDSAYGQKRLISVSLPHSQVQKQVCCLWGSNPRPLEDQCLKLTS